ncbi:hypothetical protein F3N42_12705 [Marinihelvus fidelis]|uniref:NdvB protein n=2 Tax=Marinihelvus fidelis TaxID=2613842 RepID=A0A5N0T6K2_9GAMM|nr:hypothetical protein F3N42_12705 [Marinihelvus fidelis]
MTRPDPVRPDADGRVELTCPLAMPRATAYLWNPHLVVQANCRGHVDARHMQPEPARYSYAPNLEAKTFLQPEQPPYPHQPGRFVYVRDDDDGAFFSAPHEPVRRPPEDFLFSAGSADIQWRVRNLGVEVDMTLALPADDVVELWTITVSNPGDRARRLSLFPYFTVGYMSWMNQSAAWDPALGALVARCVTPYQKLDDWPKVREMKDLTFLLPGTAPNGWEAAREPFEGEGGLHAPDAVTRGGLQNGDAIYETPLAALHYRLTLEPGETRSFRFLFGPAKTADDIQALGERYLCDGGFEQAAESLRAYQARGRGTLEMHSPDAELDAFANRWLPRQVHYQGQTNRLTTDPQTRNYLQDALGMAYVDPGATRQALRHALAQQEASGAMPDGILLNADAELTYINQVPHTDHACWVPLVLEAWLDETGDTAFLDEPISATEGPARSVGERVSTAMHWLADNRDARGLSLIAQGDWCDPMNMVGPAGRGVSGWLTMATAFALQTWASICRRTGDTNTAATMNTLADDCVRAVREHLWDGGWFARGITDDGRPFGVASEDEGKIYLNAQSWALLAGIASADQQASMLAAVEKHLDTPYGTTMLGPPYTRMHEHIGRLTQKHPGSAENGSVYNHAAAFWVRALYAIGEPDRAFATLRRMLPGPDTEDRLQRGQLPVFVPNYYRGAYELHPRTAGRSSQLINTGTAPWLYRILVEDLFGLRGCDQGLRVAPQLPSGWESARALRRFRGADFEVSYQRQDGIRHPRVTVNGVACDDAIISDIEPGRHYTVDVRLPRA